MAKSAHTIPVRNTKFQLKEREEPIINYKEQLEQFIQSGLVAFIPAEQRDVHRYHWHKFGEEMGLVTKTIKIWKQIPMCGCHNKPIIGKKPGLLFEYGDDSEYECKYECTDEDCLVGCYKGRTCDSKMRTVVVFNKLLVDVNSMTIPEIKEYLARHKVL